MSNTLTSDELCALLSRSPAVVYVNSVSLAYSVKHVLFSDNFKACSMDAVSKLESSWDKPFSLGFYRDQLRHHEDPFEAGLKLLPTFNSKQYWGRVPCKLFIGPTPTPEFILDSLLNYITEPYLRGGSHVLTYVFSISNISRC